MPTIIKTYGVETYVFDGNFVKAIIPFERLFPEAIEILPRKNNGIIKNQPLKSKG